MLNILKVVDLIKKGQNRIHCFLQNLRKKLKVHQLQANNLFKKLGPFVN